VPLDHTDRAGLGRDPAGGLFLACLPDVFAPDSNAAGSARLGVPSSHFDHSDLRDRAANGFFSRQLRDDETVGSADIDDESVDLFFYIAVAHLKVTAFPLLLCFAVCSSVSMTQWAGVVA
jgi:hypothetical protein